METFQAVRVLPMQSGVLFPQEVSCEIALAAKVGSAPLLGAVTAGHAAVAP